MKFRKTALACLTGIALQQLAVPARADSSTAPDQDAGTSVLPGVVVHAAPDSDYQALSSSIGGRTPQALRDVPQTLSVVDKALMQAQGATSLPDALRNVPGITIGGAEGGQIGNNINLRGFTARTDIYLDGFRDRGQYYRDLFDLEQLEVLQGPSSMLFGRGSTGGVINQHTKQAVLADRTEISGTLGSDGRWRSTVDQNLQLSDSAALRVNAFAQDLQTTRDVMHNRDYGLAPTLRLGIGEPTEITLSALLQHNSDMPDYGVQSLNGQPVSASPDSDYGLASDRTTQDVAMLNATVRHTLNEHWLLRDQIQANHYSTNARETAAHALSVRPALSGVLALPTFSSREPASLWVELQSHDRNIVDTSLDNQTDLIGSFQTGTLRHELVVGLEIGRDTYSNQAFSRTGPGLPLGYVGFQALAAPDPSDPAGVITSPGNRARSSADTLGIYANDTVALNARWKLVTGLRHDRFDAAIQNTTSLPAHAVQNSEFTSVRDGLIYQPDEVQSWYVAYGTSFDPLLEQMTLTNGQQNLPPTTTRSSEIGTKWDLQDRHLSLTAAAFDEQQNNVYSASNGEYSAAGNWHIRGFSAGAVGRVSQALQISAAYLHMRARVVGTSDGTAGSTPANTPQDTWNLWINYDLDPSWQLGGGAFYMSRRYVADSGISVSLPQGSIDRVSVPAYTRLDATLAWRQPRYEVRMNLLNLANRPYYDALIPSDGGRAVPGIGRTALLTVSYHF